MHVRTWLRRFAVAVVATLATLVALTVPAAYAWEPRGRTTPRGI